jgi:hypothetical protein
MPKHGDDLVQRLHREFVKQNPVRPALPTEPRTVHYSELPPSEPGSQLCQEWNFYRRNVGRLLAEGQDGKWVLIKRDAIIGVFAAEDEALKVGCQKYSSTGGFLVQRLR